MQNNVKKNSRDIRAGVKTVVTAVPSAIRRKKTAHDEKTIGVVFSNASEYAAPAILKALNETFSPHGYSLKVRDAMNSQTKEEKILKSMIAAKVDGIIIEPSKSQMLCKHMDLYRLLDRRGVPYLFIRSSYPQMIDHPKLVVDDRRGSYYVTRHLISTGRKKIIGLFKADDASGYERHRGYVEAIQETGRSYRPELVIWFHSEERFKRPVLALSQMLKKVPDCDAVVCYNDAMAQAIIQYLKGEGYLVPSDIAVTGYGNYAPCGSDEIRLTSVEIPYDTMGRKAAGMLLELMSAQKGIEEIEDAVIEPELVIRDTSML